LLAAIAIVPLAALAALEFRASQILADKVTTQSTAALAGDITEILARTVAANSVQLNELANVVELSLQLQAAAVERALGEPPPRVPVYPAAAFDGPRSGWPPATVPERIGSTLLPMSLAVASVSVPRGVDADAVSGDEERLAGVTGTLRDLALSHPRLYLSQFTALADGPRENFPGHGNFPADYDSRLRPWYVDAETRGRRIWSPPIYSAWSGQLTFVAAMPVRDPHGRFAGVSAIEVAIVDLLGRLDRRAVETDAATGSSMAGIGDALTTMLVVPAASTVSGRVDVFHILAQRSYDGVTGDWREMPALETIFSDDYAGYAALVRDVAAGHSRVVRLSYAGQDSLWAVSPVPALGAAMLLVLPYDRIAAAAGAAGATVESTANGQLRNSAILGLLMLACVAVVSLYAAGSATKSIRELAVVASRIGRGDLDARATVRGRDEIADLAAAFNAMVPQLETGIRMQQGLAIARAVQQNLLPLQPPVVAGFDLAGASVYCDETGGDYYDFVELEPSGSGRIDVAIGDVSGHGIGAALLMASVRAGLRASIDAGDAPVAAVRRANRLLCADVSDGSFMTTVLLGIDARAGTLEWVNAAHDAPVVYHRDEDRFVPAEGADVPIGIDENWAYAARSLVLGPGDVIVALGTDGIWETENSAGVAFGRARFRDLVRANAGRPAAEICRTIMNDVAAYRDDVPVADDVTLVIVAFTAKGPE
jgi:sigma-B regulation protein RsbU (phosphoserine phosphatase)